MEFLLQQGWGMMKLDKEFVENDLASGVILSPRVYKLNQIENHSKEIKELGGDILFDPQFYQPHTEREKLLEFPYWEKLDFNTSTFDESTASSFCQSCIEYQVNTLGVSKILIPGRYSNSIDEYWLEMHHNFAETAHSLDIGVPTYSTIALGPDVILNDEVFNSVLDEVTAYPTDGIYFVFRHPQDNFLIQDENILYNLLNGLLSIRLSQKDIILGYSNQQSLIFAIAGVETMASGNFRNTRCFNPEIFDVQEETDQQRATWYYDANTLSEFRIASLSLAFRRGLQNYFGPVCEYCRPLLESGDPASVRWGEPAAFRHFLYELRRQWLELADESASSVIANSIGLIETANSNLNELVSRGFHLGERSFNQSVNPTFSALRAFTADRDSDIQRL